MAILIFEKKGNTIFINTIMGFKWMRNYLRKVNNCVSIDNSTLGTFKRRMSTAKGFNVTRLKMKRKGYIFSK